MKANHVSVQEMIDLYLAGPQFGLLSPRTQRDYVAHTTKLPSTLMKSPARAIRSLTIRDYLDSEIATPVAVNRRVAFLKTVFSWARERGVVDENPCAGVTLHKEKPRDRYVTADEYDAAIALATRMGKEGRLDNRFRYITPAMELAYLCRGRRGEVLSLTRDDLKEVEGQKVLHLKRTKGSRDEYTIIQPGGRLERAVEMASDQSHHLVHTHKCERVKGQQFANSWQRFMSEFVKTGGERFTFHDLKAAGITDHPQKHGGHVASRMQTVYDRSIPLVEATR